MTRTNLTKLGNVDPTEPIIKKLRATDYFFCYKNMTLNNASLKYWFSKIQKTMFKYENGKKISGREIFSTTIYFSITADDESQKTYSFDFIVNMDVDMLNKLPEKPTNITKYIIEGEVFFDNPYTEGIEFMDVYKNDYIYQFTPSIWAQKLADKKFVFKIQFQNLFIWFLVDFNKKD